MLYMLSTNLEVYSAQKYLSIVRSRQGHLMVAFGIGPISEKRDGSTCPKLSDGSARGSKKFLGAYGR